MKSLKKQGKRWLSLFLVTAMVVVSAPQEYLTAQAAEMGENRTEESEMETMPEVSAAEGTEIQQPDSDTEQSDTTTLAQEESAAGTVESAEIETMSSEQEKETETKQQTETETKTEEQTETQTKTEEKTETETETETATTEQETAFETEGTEETSEIQATETETTEEAKPAGEDTAVKVGGVPEIDKSQIKDEGTGFSGDVKWVLDQNGTLEVTGTGECCKENTYPNWNKHASSIKAARINVKGATLACNLFNGCENLTKIDLSGFETENITVMYRMFQGCSSLTSEELNAGLKDINTANVTNMFAMFVDCSSLIDLDLSTFDTTNVTSMANMFEGCSSLTKLDLSSFDTTNVISMSYMFSGCSSLTNLDLSKFDTTKVTKMLYMFSGCNFLTDLNLSTFDIANVTDISYMFQNCSSLTNLDLSRWNFAKATNISNLFNGCKSLTNLNLTDWNTSNVTNVSNMFSGCESLKYLDLSSLDLSKVTTGYSSWLTSNTALESIVCPAKPRSGINLPEREGNAWRDSTGKKLTLLPTSDAFGTISRNKRAGIEFLGENCTLQDASGNALDLVVNSAETGTFGEKIVDFGKKDSESVTFTIKPDTGYTVKSVTLLSEEESTLILEKGSEPDQYIISPADKEKGYTRDEQIKIEIVSVADTTMSLTYHTRIEDTIVSNGTTEAKNKPTSVQISNDKDTSLYVKLNSADNTDAQEPVLYLTVGEGGERQRITYSLNTEDTTDAEKALLEQGYKIFRLGRLHEDASVEVTTQYIFSEDDIASSPDKTADVLWVIDKTGRLKITGKGALPLNSDGNPEWYEYREQITSAVVEWTAIGDCRYLLKDCTQLTEVDLSGFNVSDVWGFRQMFYNCQSLTSLDLSSLDMQNATNTDNMLNECTSLTEIKTPRNLAKDIVLPYKQEIQWRLADGTSVNNIISKEQKESTTIDAKRAAINFEEGNFVIKDANGSELKNGLLIPIGSKDVVTFIAEPAEGYVVKSARTTSWGEPTITVEAGAGINQFVVSPQDMETGYKKDESISITTDTVQQYPMEIHYNCGLSEVENVIISNGSLWQEGKSSTLSISNAYDTALYIKLKTTKAGVWRPRIEVSSIDANGNYYNKTLIWKEEKASMTEKEKELSEQGYYIYSLGGLYGDTRVNIDLSQYFEAQFTFKGFPGNVRLVRYIDNGYDVNNKRKWIQEEIKDTLLMEKDSSTYLQAIWEDKDSANIWCHPIFVADDPDAEINTRTLEDIEGEVQEVWIRQDTKIEVIFSPHIISLDYTLGDLTQITTSEGVFISEDQKELLVFSGDSVSLSFNLLEGLQLQQVSDNNGFGWNVQENNGRYTITLPDITRLYDIKTLQIEVYDAQGRTALSEANCQVTARFPRTSSKNNPVYTGEAIEADNVTVRAQFMRGTGKPAWVTMTKDRGFTVSYVNNINAGEAQMIITAVPDSKQFRGSYIYNFTIDKAQGPKSQSKIIQTETKDQQYTHQANLSELFRIENSDGKEMKPVCYRLASCNKGNVLENDPTIEGSILTYTIRSDADKTSTMANLVVYAEFDNYQDCELQINIQAVKKQKLVLGGKITVQDKEYDGKEVVFNTDELQIISVEGGEPTPEILAQIKEALTYHYTGVDGTVYDSEQSPLNIGTYKVQVKVAEKSLDYKSDYMEVGIFKITQRNLKVIPDDVKLYLDDTIPTQYGYQIEGLAEGDHLSTYTFVSCPIQSTATLAEYPIVVQTAAVKIANSEEKDVTANYQITAQEGKLTVCTPEPGSYMVTYKMSDPLRPEFDIKRSGNEAGKLIEKPVDPVAEGYIFMGWFTDAASTKEWDFAVDIIQSDITLYAGWSKTASGEETGVALCVQEILPQTYTGKALKPSVTVFAADGKTRLKLKTDYTVTYKNNTKADTATFTGGEIPQGGKGENLDDTSEGFDKRLPYVMITGKGNYKGKVYVNFHIEPADISKTESVDSKFALKYTDQFEEKPGKYAAIVTQFKYQGKALKYGTDYDLTVQKAGAQSDSSPVSLNNGKLPQNSGTYQLTITGKGNYKGELSGKILQVADKTKLLKNAKVTGVSAMSNVTKEQLAAGVEPDYSNVVVKLNNTILSKDTDYEVQCVNNHAIGTATVLITAKEQSGYIGSKSVSFKIKGAAFKANAIQMTNWQDNLTYTGKPLTQNQVALKTNDGKELIYGTDYTVSYKNNLKKGNATMVFTAKPSSGYTGSFNKKFKIVPMDLDTALKEEELLIDGAEYTGSGWKLSESVPYQKGGAVAADKISLQLKATGTTLTEGKGKDYTVSYTNNKDLGTASMTLKGAGNYAGEVTIPFTIEKASLSSLYEEGRVTITSANVAVSYSHKNDELTDPDREFKPAVTIKDGKSKLKQGVDYTISYSGNTRQDLEDSDVLSATITGIGNYEQSEDVISLEISVNRKSLSASKVKVEYEREYIYTGEEIQPAVDVEYLVGTHIEEESYDPPRYKNEGTVNEEEIMKKVTVRDWESISEGSNYRVEYSKNIAKGTATIKIIGINDYTGSVSKTFQITSKEIYNQYREPDDDDYWEDE